MSRIHSDSSIATFRNSLCKDPQLFKKESPLACNRRQVLEVVGKLLDASLLTKEETAECIRLATCSREDESVKAMRDLIQARKTLEGKAQFLKMFLSGRQKTSDRTPPTVSSLQTPPWFTITPTNEPSPLLPLISHFFTPSPAEDAPMRRPTAVRGRALFDAPPAPASTPATPGFRTFLFPAVTLSPYLFGPPQPVRYN